MLKHVAFSVFITVPFWSESPLLILSLEFSDFILVASNLAYRVSIYTMETGKQDPAEYFLFLFLFLALNIFCFWLFTSTPLLSP